MYFTNITTLDELRVERNRLAKQLHPDAGGNSTEFQDMNSEYQELLGTLGHEPNSTTALLLNLLHKQFGMISASAYREEGLTFGVIFLTLETDVTAETVLTISRWLNTVRCRQEFKGSPIMLQYLGDNVSQKPYDVCTEGNFTFVNLGPIGDRHDDWKDTATLCNDKRYVFACGPDEHSYMLKTCPGLKPIQELLEDYTRKGYTQTVLKKVAASRA